MSESFRHVASQTTLRDDTEVNGVKTMACLRPLFSLLLLGLFVCRATPDAVFVPDSIDLFVVEKDRLLAPLVSYCRWQVENHKSSSSRDAKMTNRTFLSRDRPRYMAVNTVYSIAGLLGLRLNFDRVPSRLGE